VSLPESEPSPPEPPQVVADFVRFGLYFYGAMAIAAVVWRIGFYAEPIVYASREAAAEGIDWLPDLGVGAAVGLAIVGISAVLSSKTNWGEALARSLAEQLGQISVPNALLLAFASGLAEEMFFRGALQPRVGWVLASLLFGAIHFAPRRELLPWTGFAIVTGFVLGALFEMTGNLVAPITAHVVVNGINLPMLVRDYGSPAPGEPQDPGSVDEGADVTELDAEERDEP